VNPLCRKAESTETGSRQRDAFRARSSTETTSNDALSMRNDTVHDTKRTQRTPTSVATALGSRHEHARHAELSGRSSALPLVCRRRQESESRDAHHLAAEAPTQVTDRAERPLLCPGDVPLTTATSALIKSLRRGRELEALWWAQLIEVRFPKYVLRKLAVFACEDVGLADPQAVVVVSSIATAYRADLTESRSFRPDKNLLAMAVTYLARAPKSRECDDLANALQHLVDEQGWSPPIPSRVYDFHTPEGRAHGTDASSCCSGWSRVAGSSTTKGRSTGRLWIDRAMARRGVLDRDDVERQAVEWDQAGRLRYGVDGYPPRPD
jgi:hypothetical protein